MAEPAEDHEAVDAPEIPLRAQFDAPRDQWRLYPWGRDVAITVGLSERPVWWRRWLQAVFLGWRWEWIE